MKHTLQFGVQAQGVGTVQVRVECTCGAIFASRSLNATSFNHMSADVKARLWAQAKPEALAHASDEPINVSGVYNRK